MIGEDIKIVFVGHGGGYTRIMIDAPREVNIVRSRALEKKLNDPALQATIPKYYKETEHPEKYVYKDKTH